MHRASLPRGRVPFALRSVTYDRSIAVRAEHSLLHELSRALDLKLCSKVSVTDSRHGLGRSLVAEVEVPPGGVLLSLPLSKAFQFTEGKEQEHEIPWSLAMALDILRERAAKRASDYRPWVEALPAAVDLSLPISDAFTEEELLACQDAQTVHTAQSIRAMLKEAKETLAEDLEAMSASAEDLSWALCCVHSRSFVVGGSGGTLTHVVAPGIDMANHSFQPTAGVRIEYSPDTCQGREAVEEVCQPPAEHDSRIELFALEAGIREGEEVTISYGQFPDDVFYLFYGFLPRHNPFNSVLLFRDPSEVARHLEVHHDVPRRIQLPPQLSGKAENADTARLIATAEGFGQATLDAVVQRLSLKHSRAARELLSPPERAKLPQGRELGGPQLLALAMDSLAERCRQVAGEFPTSPEQDRVLLDQCEISAAKQLSIRYRLRKKLLLQHIIRTLAGMRVQA